MPEEFVEDIIASTEEVQPNNEQITNSDDVAPVEKETSTEAPEDLETSNSDDSSSSDETPNSDDESIESLASKLGWRADHDGENSVDAATYILRSKEIQASMKDHNKDLKNQLSVLQNSVEALKEHNERVYKAELKRMQSELEELQSQKREAVELADVSKVESIDKQIEDIKGTLSTPVKKSEAAPNDVYDDWVKDNTWYLTDNDMATYADQVAQQYVGAPIERIYSIVRNKVAEVWPEKFEQNIPTEEKLTSDTLKVADVAKSKKAKPIGPASPVEASTKSGSVNSFTKANLTPDQLSIMNQFVRGGIMTEEQYISDLAKLQEA